RRFVPVLAVGDMSGALFRCWPWEHERHFVPVLAVGDMSGVLFRCWPWGYERRFVPALVVGRESLSVPFCHWSGLIID
ncbi:TPA: hypothetical protein SCR58_004987, partial [Citrobacter freundii]|nr:hypothetical protein [Citrobacter freundii]